MCCKLIDNIADIRNIPIKEIQTWKPLMFAMYTSMYAIRQQTNTTFWTYFTNALKDFLNILTDECKIDDQSYVVDQSKLLEFRLTNSCGLAFLSLLLYSDDIDLTDEELNYPLLQNVFNNAVKSMQMCNDLYSFRKEIKEFNGMLEKSMNMIAVVMRTQSLTLQQAFNKQVDILNRLDEEYEKSKQTLFDSNPSASLRRMCCAIDKSIGGNWIFHLGSKRYHGPNFKGCIPSSGKFIYSPNETVILPSINQENKFEKFQNYYNF